ncbi:unnamed protein product [Symbiodinium natans]|uniref:Transmembrane protein n=1 Tax=Symbiodinium natans TaxID=878477 RepID=A0A812UVE5_9DINO|nr:unnamed protein product [Symbiodinium natans]
MAAAEGKVHTQVKSSTMGRFLTLADSVIRPGAQLQARDGLVGECTNVGLISALMLTMVVPMTYENVADWLEEDYPGSGHLFVDSYLGQLAGEDAVAKAAPILNDVAMIFYLIGFAGFLCSTISTVLILLCVGELQTEMGCQQFMKRVGDFTRMPYLFFMVGFYYAFAALIRYLVTVKTLGGLICLCIGMLLFAPCIALTCCFFVRCCIRAHNCMNEFEELHLADSEVDEDVDAWFAHNSRTRTLEQCLIDLSGLAPESDLLIKLDGISQERVSIQFHKKHAKSLKIDLSPADLYRLACDRPSTY